MITKIATIESALRQPRPRLSSSRSRKVGSISRTEGRVYQQQKRCDEEHRQKRDEDRDLRAGRDVLREQRDTLAVHDPGHDDRRQPKQQRHLDQQPEAHRNRRRANQRDRAAGAHHFRGGREGCVGHAWCHRAEGKCSTWVSAVRP
jgi:hypothetical protein